jgi:hypothetical protein
MEFCDAILGDSTAYPRNVDDCNDVVLAHRALFPPQPCQPLLSVSALVCAKVSVTMSDEHESLEVFMQCASSLYRETLTTARDRAVD